MRLRKLKMYGNLQSELLIGNTLLRLRYPLVNCAQQPHLHATVMNVVEVSESYTDRFTYVRIKNYLNVR